MSKNEYYPFIGFIIATTLFGLIPNVFFNYGWNYYQFLPFPLLVFPIALIVYLANWSGKFKSISSWFILLAAILLPICFYVFRTKVHAFGGDVNIAPMLSPDFTVNDYRWRIPPKLRFDEIIIDIVEKSCHNLGVFKQTDLIPSMLANIVHAIVFGSVFVILAAIIFRKNPNIFFIIATAPFIFNFFGNTDSYAFMLCMSLTFFAWSLHLWKLDELKLSKLIPLGVFWICISIAHPLQLFGGFIVALLFTKYLKQFKKFEQLPWWLFPVLYAIVFFSIVKVSSFGNPWLYINPTDNKSPVFSKDLLIHWFNMMFLPVIPFAIAVWYIDRGEFKRNAIIYVGQSMVFFVLGFAMGADDQFNYQQLLFYYLMPWLFTIATKETKTKLVMCILACQLSLLVPMIAVHSTHATMERAEKLYPIDTSRHNGTMSWQTHLALIYSDNFQNDYKIREAVLRVFEDGSKFANPEGFRLGNFIYHTAFLYQYGRLAQGRKQLYWLLENYPQSINWFLSPRPSFIICNRKLLWNDIHKFLEERNEPVLEQYDNIVSQLIEINNQHPYLDHTPVWAITD